MNSPTQSSNHQERHYSPGRDEDQSGQQKPDRQKRKTGEHQSDPHKPVEQKNPQLRAGGSVKRQLPDPSQTMEAIIHEIRNPLTAIRLANESLAKETASAVPAMASFTEIVSKNITRIEVILKQLLNANHATSIKFSPVDLCDVIEKSLQKADDRILMKKIKIIKAYGFDLIVNGVADQLVVAFLNIVTNAIEAVDHQGKIWITVYRARDEIKVIFKDNGEGMEPDIAARIFERSFTRSKNGLGVGLATVKEILGIHDASIAINSERGTGTSVIISFTGLS